MASDHLSQVEVHGSPGGFLTQVETGAHRLIADEPEGLGGRDQGPSPYDLLLAALGACTAMTLRMYADRKGWPLTDVHVRLTHRKIHARDCAECESDKGFIDRITREIRVEGAIDAEQRQRLLEIANKCPVHKTLHAEVNVVSSLVD